MDTNRCYICLDNSQGGYELEKICNCKYAHFECIKKWLYEKNATQFNNLTINENTKKCEICNTEYNNINIVFEEKVVMNKNLKFILLIIPYMLYVFCMTHFLIIDIKICENTFDNKEELKKIRNKYEMLYFLGYIINIFTPWFCSINRRI